MDTPHPHWLLACSLAWGANTPGLARWLASPADNRPEEPAATSQRLIQQGAVARWADWLAQHDWQLLHPGHRHWPRLLDTLEDPPGVLFVRGDPSLPGDTQLAMVGARQASPEGCRHARAFARSLAATGMVITSGLALGIDGAAHRGALEQGRTLAVLAHGPERLYPARHAGLATDIVRAGGALVTEFPPGTPPLRALFPQRNRLIAGMSLATLVIEARERSGSLVTARLAAELGREVFAMPGAIHNPFSRGCHRLLRDGANWLESLEDVAALVPELAGLADNGTAPAPAATGLLTHFRDGINRIDALQQRSGLTAQALACELARLELTGQISRAANGYIREG